MVTGINGFVGNYLYEELFSNDYYIIGLDVDDYCKCKSQEYYKLDIQSQEAIKLVIERSKPEVIIHLAAQSNSVLSWEIPSKTLSINVLGSINILEAVKEYNKNIICLFIGSSMIYASSESKIEETSPLEMASPYSISKMAQEQFAELYWRQYGIRTIVTRSFNHIGIGQSDKAANFKFLQTDS